MTDGERLVIVETKIGALTELVVKLDAKLDLYNANFLPRREFIEVIKFRDERIGRIEEKVERIQDEQITSLKSDIVALQEEKVVRKIGAPQWGIVIVSLLAFIVSVILLVVRISHG